MDTTKSCWRKKKKRRKRKGKSEGEKKDERGGGLFNRSRNVIEQNAARIIERRIIQ